jgi:hypothetical protein
MIADAIREYIAGERYSSPAQSNRASELGHPCTRYLCYLRREKKPLVDVGLQEVFREGNDQEIAVRRLLEDAGFVFTRSQQAFNWPDLQLSGHIDGMLGYHRRPTWWPTGQAEVPCEIKTCSPWIFQGLDTVDDLTNGKQLWLRKWPDQMQVYLLLTDQPVGVIVLKDKTAARVKDLWIDLDWDRASELVRKAEEVNAHLSRQTYPDRTEGDHCAKCDFVALCHPAILNRDGAALLSDPEIEEMLARRESLADAAREYEALGKQIQGKVPEGLEQALVGDWLITGKWIERKERTTPASRYWVRKYERIGVEVAA